MAITIHCAAAAPARSVIINTARRRCDFAAYSTGRMQVMPTDVVQHLLHSPDEGLVNNMLESAAIPPEPGTTYVLRNTSDSALNDGLRWRRNGVKTFVIEGQVRFRRTYYVDADRQLSRKTCSCMTSPFTVVHYTELRTQYTEKTVSVVPMHKLCIPRSDKTANGRLPTTFQYNPRNSRYRNVSAVSVVVQYDDGSGDDNWNYVRCNAGEHRHHQQADTQLFTCT